MQSDARLLGIEVLPARRLGLARKHHRRWSKEFALSSPSTSQHSFVELSQPSVLEANLSYAQGSSYPHETIASAAKLGSGIGFVECAAGLHSLGGFAKAQVHCIGDCLGDEMIGKLGMLGLKLIACPAAGSLCHGHWFPLELNCLSFPMDPLYLALLLYVAALALAVVDLFVPSGGMLLVLATLAALAAVLFGFRSGNAVGMATLTLVIATVPAFVVLAINIWPHTPIGKRIILKLPSAEAVSSRPESDPLRELIGHVLLAETAFLPTGQVRVGHRRFNAVAESGFIEAGTHVRVLSVRERNLIVRATDEPLTARAVEVNLEKALDSASEAEGNLLDRPAEEIGLDSLDD